MRVYIKISYDGSKFLGFQKQNSTKNTVSNSIISACEVLGINNEPVGSGRTDKGVHANNQSIHLDLPSFWSDLDYLKTILNRHLNPHIHVKKIYPVKNHFHARFSPIKREYRYVFYHGEFAPFLSSYVHFYPEFDTNKLDEILSVFKGKHNFKFFKKNGSEHKSFEREIYDIKAVKYQNQTIMTVKANSFLRSQIRMMVSAILKTYEGKLTCKKIEEQLNLKCIHTQSLCSPSGLYLHRIFYKSDIFLS